MVLQIVIYLKWATPDSNVLWCQHSVFGMRMLLLIFSGGKRTMERKVFEGHFIGYGKRLQR